MTTRFDLRRGSRTPETPCKVLCPDCGKFHFVDRETFAYFGFDCLCIPCCDDKHDKFIHTTGRRLGLN